MFLILPNDEFSFLLLYVGHKCCWGEHASGDVWLVLWILQEEVEEEDEEDDDGISSSVVFWLLLLLLLFDKDREEVEDDVEHGVEDELGNSILAFFL